MKNNLFVAITIAVLAGCTSPKLTRHYGSVDETVHSSDELKLSVFVSASKLSDEVPLVLQLSERGQAELIRSVSARVPAGENVAALLASLAKAPETNPDPCSWADKTSLKKRVTLTVLGNMLRPADRIDRLTYVFDMQGVIDRVRFASWDKFDSVYGSYDLGSAKYTQSNKLTLGRSANDTKNLPDATGSTVNLLSFGAEASEGLEENMNYAIRRLSVGGALTESDATLVQEGGPYINLLGSSSAAFTLRVTDGGPLAVHVVALPQKNATQPDNVVVTRCTASYANSTEDVKVSVAGSAVKRLVMREHETLSEGDDWVKFETKDFKPISLLIATKADLETRFFGLVYCPHRPASGADCLRLAIENPDATDAMDAIKLRTPADAAALRSWLIANSAVSVPHSIGGQSIGLVNSPESGGDISKTKLDRSVVKALRVELVGGNVR